jgi:CRP-like cAMP-binding protein
MLPAEASVFSSEQPGEAVYFLLRGTAKICVEQPDGSDVIVGICGAGDVLGESGVLAGREYSTSAITLENSEILWLERATFCGFLQSMPAMTHNLAQVLAERLQRANRQTRSLAVYDVYGRLACQLLTFAREYGGRNDTGGILIPIRLTQSDLASLVGATRESVNKALACYKRCGIISTDQRHYITIHDEAALQRRCR